MKKRPDIFVVCGEKSGDLLAAKVLKPLKDKLSIQGCLGPELTKLGFEKLFAMEGLEVIGFWKALSSLFRVVTLFRTIKKAILQNNPKVVLLVDSVEFNLFLGRSLRKAGFTGKIVQLVCPTIWAWRKNRKKTLEKYFDLLLTIFPFEEKLFEGSQLKAKYIGHPIIDDLVQVVHSKRLTHLNDKRVIAVFPGSRKREIEISLDIYLEALKNFSGYEIAIAVAGEKHIATIQKIADKSQVKVHLIPFEDRYELMQKAEVALSKLGTVNLELAFFEVPTVIAAPLPSLELFLLQFVFKIFLPHYSLVNLIASRRVMPEYIACYATLTNLRNELKNFLTNPIAKQRCIEGAKEVKSILEGQSGKESASKLILDLI